jgi:hypothetical protein
MADVDDPGVGRELGDDPVDDADELVVVAEVGQEADWQ